MNLTWSQTEKILTILTELWYEENGLVTEEIKIAKKGETK